MPEARGAASGDRARRACSRRAAPALLGAVAVWTVLSACAGSLGSATTPLHEAAKSDRSEEASRLLADGAAVNARGEHGYTPLHWASWRGHAEIVGKLLDAGADVGVRSTSGATPLHLAANAAIAEQLLAAGSELEARDHEGRTPLYAAARSNSAAVADRLLAAGAEPEAADSDGSTPLREAISREHAAAAASLVAGGAEARAADLMPLVESRTPARFLLDERRRSFFRMLVAAHEQGVVRVLLSTGFGDLGLGAPWPRVEPKLFGVASWPVPLRSSDDFVLLAVFEHHYDSSDRGEILVTWGADDRVTPESFFGVGVPFIGHDTPAWKRLGEPVEDGRPGMVYGPPRAAPSYRVKRSGEFERERLDALTLASTGTSVLVQRRAETLRMVLNGRWTEERPAEPLFGDVFGYFTNDEGVEPSLFVVWTTP